MLYFAYGSNLSSRRLHSRIPGARRLGVATLVGYELKFHKIGKDNSAKCDAFETGDDRHAVQGGLYEVSGKDLIELDSIEGEGAGYERVEVRVTNPVSDWIQACTYVATEVDSKLLPYHWYLFHVIQGALENQLPRSYLEKIRSVQTIADPNVERAKRETTIYQGVAARSALCGKDGVFKGMYQR